MLTGRGGSLSFFEASHFWKPFGLSPGGGDPGPKISQPLWKTKPVSQPPLAPRGGGGWSLEQLYTRDSPPLPPRTLFADVSIFFPCPPLSCLTLASFLQSKVMYRITVPPMVLIVNRVRPWSRQSGNCQFLSAAIMGSDGGLPACTVDVLVNLGAATIMKSFDLFEPLLCTAEGLAIRNIACKNKYCCLSELCGDPVPILATSEIPCISKMIGFPSQYCPHPKSRLPPPPAVCTDPPKISQWEPQSGDHKDHHHHDHHHDRRDIILPRGGEVVSRES